MKNYFILALLLFCTSGTIAIAQQKKTTTTTKKSTTTVKSSAPKATTTKTTSTTTTSNAPVVAKPVEEKKTTTTTTTSSSTSSSAETSSPSTTTTTTIQSTGPSKGAKAKTPDTKPEKEAKPEKVREPKPERVRATSSNEDGVKFGIRAEGTQAYSLESGSNYDLSPGVNVGLIVNLPLSSKISIQPEILYSMTTAKVSVDANNYAKGTGSSILVPLMFNFNFGSGPTKFMLNLGGYANYALSANLKLVSAGVTISDGAVTLGNDKFDYGAGIGLGVKLNNSFMIEARSFYGLKDNIGKNGIGTIGIGYLF